MPVRSKISTAGRVRAQGLQHLFCKESTRAVARVHNDPKPRQRTLPSRGVGDLPAQKRGIGLHKATPFFAAPHICRGERFTRKRQDRADIRTLRAAVCGKELHAVSVPRKMASRDHDRGVERTTRQHRRHEHCRRCGKPEVRDLDPRLLERCAERFRDRRSGQPRITSHGNAQLRRFRKPCAQPPHKAARDRLDRLRVQIHVLPRHAAQCHAADIAAVLQFHQIHQNASPLNLLPLLYASPPLQASKMHEKRSSRSTVP